MAKKSFAIMAAFVLLGMTPQGAAAEERERLDGKAAAKAVLGRELSGRLMGDGAPWRECIEASGRTLYWFGGVAQRGRVRFDPSDRACFSYETDDFAKESCFFVERVNGQLRFVSVDQPTTFAVDRVTPVPSCHGRDAQS
jgi:hypothetical protein